MGKVSSIVVLEHEIKIEYCDMEDWGQCLLDEKIIKINKNQ